MFWRSTYRVPKRPANSWMKDMRRMNRQLDYLFGGTQGPIRAEYPLLNAWSGDDGLVIAAEVPGVAKDELEITVDGRTLTLSGTRLAEELPEDARQYRRERNHGEFSRTVELPFDVDVEKVEANYVGGVLEIELPRLPEEKPRKITLNGS